MICPNCGNVLPHGVTKCPRCEQRKMTQQTKKLPDMQTMHTQHLVSLEQCPRCRFMLYPGDTVCGSCGTVVAHGDAKPNAGMSKRERIVTGLALGAMLIVFVALFLLLRQAF